MLWPLLLCTSLSPPWWSALKCGAAPALVRGGVRDGGDGGDGGTGGTWGGRKGAVYYIREPRGLAGVC